MTKKEIAGGVVHKMLADFRKAISSDLVVQDVWGISHRWRAMNGFAGLHLPRRIKPETAASPSVLIRCIKACTGLAVGPAVLIGEVE